MAEADVTAADWVALGVALLQGEGPQSFDIPRLCGRPIPWFHQPESGSTHGWRSRKQRRLRLLSLGPLANFFVVNRHANHFGLLFRRPDAPGWAMLVSFINLRGSMSSIPQDCR